MSRSNSWMRCDLFFRKRYGHRFLTPSRYRLSFSLSLSLSLSLSHSHTRTLHSMALTMHDISVTLDRFSHTALRRDANDEKPNRIKCTRAIASAGALTRGTEPNSTSNCGRLRSEYFGGSVRQPNGPEVSRSTRPSATTCTPTTDDTPVSISGRDGTPSETSVRIRILKEKRLAYCKISIHLTL